MEKLQREQILNKGSGKEGKEDRNSDGVLLKRDLENEGEEWRKRATNRKISRLLIEKIEIKK